MSNTSRPRSRSLINLAYDRGLIYKSSSIPMDSSKSTNGKKNFIVKTWERCRSIPRTSKEKSSLSKSKSWHAGISMKKEGARKENQQVAPEGCFSVYVGPDKQRFAVKAKYANHPLFEMLLEDAESEYGHNSNGPIMLPCDVDFFYKVLADMESEKEIYQHGCGFVHGSCSPFNPSRRLGNSDMAKGHGSYGFLTPALKMN